MKNYIKEIYDEAEHDGFMFILDDANQLDISAFTYKTRSKPIEIHPDLGYKYHIITYRELIDGRIVDPDVFEAVIGNPYHYVDNLLSCGFFGSISKKTKSSSKFVKSMYTDLLQSIKDQGPYEE